MNDETLKQRATAVADFTKEIRRQLHRIPELGFQEHKTQRLIMDTLDTLGVPYTTDRTWVVGTIQGGKPGKTVALRADIDGLPIQEQTGLPFASEHEGRMHACGHDAHAANQLGTAKLLMGMREEFPGTVRLLFQPAEESFGGAEPMVLAGAMDGVDAVYGLHVAAQAPVGRIGSRPGAMYAATDELFIDVLGKKGHGAHPAGGVDAIVIAAQIITALQTLVTREIEATDAAIVTIGSIHGGAACNILCDEVKLHGTLRTLTPALREQFGRRIQTLCKGIAAAMGGDVRISVRQGYPACVNDPAESDRVLAVAKRLLGEEKIKKLTNSSMGGEDFAYYLQKAPGAIYHLGCGSETVLHNERFIIDEDCLPIGVCMQAALALDFLGAERAGER